MNEVQVFIHKDEQVVTTVARIEHNTKASGTIILGITTLNKTEKEALLDLHLALKLAKKNIMEEIEVLDRKILKMMLPKKLESETEDKV